MKMEIRWRGQKLGILKNEKQMSHLYSYLRVSKSDPNLQLLPLESSEEVGDPMKKFVDADGGLFGVRFFATVRSQTRVWLLSPTSAFLWESESATAKDFSNNGAVRGHIGFHAAWPEDLKTWELSYVDHQVHPVKALVKGYGDVVVGDEGWRSEEMMIVSVQSLLAEEIMKHYKVSGIVGEPVNPENKILWLVKEPRNVVHPRRAKILTEFKA